MKKLITFLIVLLLWAGSSLGQSAIIGTGTLNTNGTGADPVERYFNYEHFQIVYTAAELTAAGMPSGAVINSLGFSVSESAVSLANYTISMGHTTQATADPYISTGLTIVKTSFTYAPVVQTAGNFDMIAFTTNFTWDGTSNIVVNTCTGSNPYGDPKGGLRYTSATNGAVRYIRSDGGPGNCSTATTNNSTSKPNIRFDYTGGTACTGTPGPGNTISSENPACSGINFTLSLQYSTSGSGVTYQWQSSPNGSAPWTNIGTSTPSHTTTQSTATWYRCQVTCSGNTGTSVPVNVTINSFFIPFTQSFDDVTPPEMPDCMVVTNDNADANEWITSTEYPRSEPNSMYIGYNAEVAMNDWFYSPPLTLAVGEYKVSFWYRNYAYYPEKLEVKWGSAPNAAAMTNGPIFNNNNIATDIYIEGTGYLTVTVAGDYFVGWHGYSDTDMNFLVVDDITIEIHPFIWTGNTNTNWNEPLNWDGLTAPDALSYVIIPSDPESNPDRFPVIVNGQVVNCNTITIVTGASVTVQPGGTLNVLYP